MKTGIGDDDAVEPCCSPELKKSNGMILKNLAICIATFYSGYYCIAAMMHGIFEIGLSFNGREPFNFSAMSNLDFSIEHREATASMLSMEASYLLTTVVATWCLTSRLWDYAITITVLHVFLSSAVMLRFPTQWQWWLAIGIGTVLMITLGESAIILLRQRSKRRAISVLAISATENGHNMRHVT